MIYMLDTANLKSIKKACDLYPIQGITTNPTIISKENRNFLEVLKDIRSMVGNDVMMHVQVLGKTSDQMVKEALYLNEKVGGNTYIKIPVIKEGIKAIKILKNKGIKTTATAIFTAQQALMAATAGADFVAPYVNRIDNISGNGIEVVYDIMNEFKLYNIKTKVVGASFKNVQQVHELSKIGIHSVTVNPEIMNKMIEHPLTDLSVDNFISDWESTYKTKKLML